MKNPRTPQEIVDDYRMKILHPKFPTGITQEQCLAQLKEYYTGTGTNKYMTGKPQGKTAIEEYYKPKPVAPVLCDSCHKYAYGKATPP